MFKNPDAVIAIVAILALIQPWLFSLYNRFWKTGKLHIYPTGGIEIGFSDFGPTLTLQGTLACETKDVFVQRMEVKVKNKKTSETHNLLWLAARSPRINLANPADQTLEIPSSFLCKIDQPYRYVLVFNDRDTQDVMRPCLEKVIRKTDSIATNILGLVRDPSEHEAKFKELRPSKEYKDAYNDLNEQIFYWKSGVYEVTLNVICDKPKREFSNVLTFTLSEEDVELLRLNIINILENRLRQYLGYQPFPYNFAYPRS